MSDSTSKKIAFILALLLTMLAFVLFITLDFFESRKDSLWVMLSAFLLFAFLQYLILNYSLQKYIYNRIKLVYKTIHTQKLKKEDKKEQLLNNKDDIIGKVTVEVEKWATDRTQEIDELRKMEIYRREFMGNVSHELKTPLFNIQGFVLTLLEGGLSDTSINVSFLQKTQKNIERMITIVEDLEIISRLETGEATPMMTTFSLPVLVREVIEFMEPKAAEKEIKLQFATEYADSMLVKADKEKIRTVLNNLIENSIKYGIIKGRTKITFYDMDDNYLIEISDNGVGVEETHIPRLFERFYRIDKHRSRLDGGSGLGLAIVKHIIEAHNQTINVRSTLGIGSTFSFTIKKSKN